MTGRQKIEAALSAGGSRETPAVICYEGIYVRDHWDKLTGRPWWYRFSPDIEHQLAWRRDVLAAVPQDWFALPACAPKSERDATRIEQRRGGVVLVDRRTGSQRRLKRPGVSGWDPASIPGRGGPLRLPRAASEVDALIPLPGRFDVEGFAASGRGDLAAALLEEFGQDRFPIASVGSPLWSCYGLWGFEALMTLIADRPDLVARAAGRILAAAVRSVRQAAALGAAGIWIEECLTDLISPAAFASLNVPVLGRLIEAIRSAGMKSIYYYCGDPAGKWGHILSLGVDALSLEESKKGFSIDIEAVAGRLAGRCALLGNVDAIGAVQDGTEAALRSELARQLAAGRANRGRFIMSLGSPPTPATPPDRIRLYLDLTRRLAGG